MCFAYKIKEEIEFFYVGIIDSSRNIYSGAEINEKMVADQQWHYICIDVYSRLLESNPYLTLSNYFYYSVSSLFEIHKDQLDDELRLIF